MSYTSLMQAAREKALKAQQLLANEDAGDDAVTQANALIVEAEDLQKRAESMKSAQSIAQSIGEPQRDLPFDLDEDDGDGGDIDPVQKSIYVMRYGDVTSKPEHQALVEVYGGDYRDIFNNQAKSFRRFLLDEKYQGNPVQLWPVEATVDMLKSGMTVEEVKATMVEGTDTLGGHAVPAEMSSKILQESMGLTAVRSSGATVVRTASKSIDWLKITGADASQRYPNAMRGAWAGETKNPPDETNLTFGLETIPVNIYTFKVPMSVSLLEDAQNIEAIFRRAVSETLAVDEDDAFIVGDGIGKPLGLLPQDANANGINEVSVSGGAITMDGLKLLRRGVASQYRANRRATLLGTSESAGDIETLKDGDNRYFIDQLSAGEYVPQVTATWRESEAMPEVGANTYPLLYGDFSSYIIVERLGLAVRRYNDSGTGINLVQFQVRRRLGGRLMEPWKLAVMKITA